MPTQNASKTGQKRNVCVSDYLKHQLTTPSQKAAPVATAKKGAQVREPGISSRYQGASTTFQSTNESPSHPRHSTRAIDSPVGADEENGPDKDQSQLNRNTSSQRAYKNRFGYTFEDSEDDAAPESTARPSTPAASERPPPSTRGALQDLTTNSSPEREIWALRKQLKTMSQAQTAAEKACLLHCIITPIILEYVYYANCFDA